MAESFDAFRYISYLRSRWLWIAASCAAAGGIALIVSMMMQRQYTATAQIVIEPPAGIDARTATAVSPIYLESLKTYEHFAGGDSLFQGALDKFNLRSSFGGASIESIKRRVLRVGTVRNTRILEISATLPDPKRSLALARYLADSTVALNQSTESEGENDLIQGIVQQETQAKTKLDKLDAEWARLTDEEPVAELQSAIGRAGELHGTLQQQVFNTQLEIADAADRQKAGSVEQTEARNEASNAAARLAEMKMQLQELDAQTQEKEKLLALRMAHRDQLDAERRAAQGALTAIEIQLREAESGAGYRGERLRVIDPGVVPERPSSPNLPLNVLGALLLGLVLPVLYLTLEMNYQDHKASERRSGFHALPKTSENRP